MAVVTIFGSSQAEEGDPDYERGRRLGKRLAESGFTVCNGGYGGLMEATARGAKEGGGKAIGVTTEDFGGAVNRWIDQEVKMRRWSERLFKLIELGDAYVIFDGGTGTLVELFVVWEMVNKNFLGKPILILGRELHRLVSDVRNWPHVTDPPELFLVRSEEEVLKVLKR